MINNRLYFVVDDDPLIRTLIIKRLASQNTHVKAFPRGEECVAALEENPDIIILDFIFSSCETSYRDGMEIFDMIRELKPHMPIIMLSGQEDGAVVLEFARKGVNDYVIKDQNLIDNLLAAINDINDRASSLV